MPMTDVTVRALSEDDWEAFRAIRLAALADAPDAFAASRDDEQGYDDEDPRAQAALAETDSWAAKAACWALSSATDSTLWSCQPWCRVASRPSLASPTTSTWEIFSK